MLRRILSAVGIVALGFALVVAFVCWNLGRVRASVQTATATRIPAYESAVHIKELAERLRSEVGATFLSRLEGDLVERGAAISALLKSLETEIAGFSAPAFAELREEPLALSSADAPSDGQAPTPDDPKPAANIGELIGRLGEDHQALAAAATQALELATRRVRDSANLAIERENLSKLFRRPQTQALAAPDAKAYGYVARAILLALYSDSTSDLNYIGRARFNEGAAAIEKAGLDDESRLTLAALRTQFDKTLDLAISISSSRSDVRFFADLLARLEADADTLRRHARDGFHAGQTTIETQTRSIIRLSILVSVATILLGGLAATFIARRLARSFRLIVDKLTRETLALTESSRDLGAQGETLSGSASAQAASLEEVGSAVTELAASAQQNTEATAHGNSAAVEARAQAEAGAAEMAGMHSAMQAIQTSSNDIARIIKTIDEIAFQTNILALNAAVEAARAGEAGAGFAVVAEEVRSLARRSAEASQETAEKIAAAIARSTQGVDYSTRVSTAFANIVEKVREVDRRVAEVAASSREQSLSLGGIRDAIVEMDKATQSNAAGADQSATTARALHEQSEKLAGLADQLAAAVR